MTSADDPAEATDPWQRILVALAHELADDEFRRWFKQTAYASDSGDRITVWTPSEAVRKHLVTHYDDAIGRALHLIGRGDATVRFVVSGFEDEVGDE